MSCAPRGGDGEPTASAGAAASAEPAPSPSPTPTREELAAADIVLFTGETKQDLELGGYGFRKATISSPGPRIRVEVGHPVTIGLRNVHGYLDGESIPHDFAVVTRRAEGSTPLWSSQLAFIQAGENGLVTFTPTEPGSFFYICTLSGHLESHGMWGRFVVTG